jgi:predicted DNA-binding protein YlxM (UPF0122 family)
MRATQRKRTERLVESHRRTLQILEDQKAMEGIYEALQEAKKGERGEPGRELKRKYKGA